MGQNDFHEINVYIKRDGSENWLCANFLHEKGYSQLGTINFIEDYEKERSARQRNLPGSKSYAGPDLMSL